MMSADFIPEDVSLGLTQLDGSGAEALCWGICGAGSICNDFIMALQNIPNSAKVVHIGCRDKERAVKLVDKLGVTGIQCSGSYEDVFNDPNVEIVYIGTITISHKALTLAAIAKGKHVCVEKPAADCLADVQEMADAARAKGVFLMENLWTSFFPAVAHMRQCLKDGVIGKVNYAWSMLIEKQGIYNEGFSVEGCQHIMMSQEMGCYPIACVNSVFENAPRNIKAVGKFLTGDSKNDGKDVPRFNTCASGVLEFDDGIGTVTYDSTVNGLSGTMVMGTKGYIKLGPHCQCPTNITVISEEKAAQQHVDNGDLNAGIEYCIPDVHACRTGKTPEYVFVNSAGLQYSAAAIYRCIRSGLKECPQYTIEVVKEPHVIDPDARTVEISRKNEVE